MVLWAALCGLPALASASLGGDGIQFFRIGTASSDLVHFAIGTLIAGAVSNPPGSRPCDRGGSCGVPGLIATAQTTGGMPENLDLLRRGQLEAAIVQADLALSEQSGIAALASLYPQVIHVVVKSDSSIESPADLHGQRIAVGEAGSATAAYAYHLLSALGLTEGSFEPVHLTPSDAADRLATGSIDAMMLIGGTPVDALAELASELPVRLIPLPNSEATLAGVPCCVETATIPDGTYANLESVQTWAIPTVLLVRNDLPDALVYELTRALWHPSHRSLFDDAGAAGEAIKLDRALRKLPVPLHPGALRFYREKGLLGDPDPMEGDGRDAMVRPTRSPSG